MHAQIVIEAQEPRHFKGHHGASGVVMMFATIGEKFRSLGEAVFGEAEIGGHTKKRHAIDAALRSGYIFAKAPAQSAIEKFDAFKLRFVDFDIFELAIAGIIIGAIKMRIDDGDAIGMGFDVACIKIEDCSRDVVASLACHKIRQILHGTAFAKWIIKKFAVEPPIKPMAKKGGQGRIDNGPNVLAIKIIDGDVLDFVGFAGLFRLGDKEENLIKCTLLKEFDRFVNEGSIFAKNKGDA